MYVVKLEVERHVDLEVAKKLKVSVNKLQIKYEEKEAYYNEGIDVILEMMALVNIYDLEDEDAKIRHLVIGAGFKENAISTTKAWDIFDLTAKAYYELGFKTGFKEAMLLQGRKNSDC
jgi:hypothetical protein